MNFNIYIDDATCEQLNAAAKQVGESRNALVRQAVNEWLHRHGTPQWPEEILNFTGIPDMPAFESDRESLRQAPIDPLA